MARGLRSAHSRVVEEVASSHHGYLASYPACSPTQAAPLI